MAVLALIPVYCRFQQFARVSISRFSFSIRYIKTQNKRSLQQTSITVFVVHGFKAVTWINKFLSRWRRILADYTFFFFADIGLVPVNDWTKRFTDAIINYTDSATA
jgi:hypothetical protein